VGIIVAIIAQSIARAMMTEVNFFIFQLPDLSYYENIFSTAARSLSKNQRSKSSLNDSNTVNYTMKRIVCQQLFEIFVVLTNNNGVFLSV
jgi:hypothetical protein